MPPNNHIEDQPLSELQYSLKIAEIDQLEGLARYALDLEIGEGGILRIAGHRHDGVLVTIDFMDLISQVKDRVPAYNDEDLVITNIKTVEKTIHSFYNLIMSLRKRAKYLKGKPLGFFQKVQGLEDEIRSLKNQLKKSDAKYQSLETHRINLNAEREMALKNNREMGKTIARLEKEAQWWDHELRDTRERLEIYERAGVMSSPNQPASSESSRSEPAWVTEYGDPKKSASFGTAGAISQGDSQMSACDIPEPAWVTAALGSDTFETSGVVRDGYQNGGYEGFASNGNGYKTPARKPIEQKGGVLKGNASKGGPLKRVAFDGQGYDTDRFEIGSDGAGGGKYD